MIINREFPRQVMRDIASENTDDYAVVREQILDTPRWATVHEMVFKELSTGKCYRSYYNRGATEMQDESPYEYDSPLISCQEVVEKEVMTKLWVNREE